MIEIDQCTIIVLCVMVRLVPACGTVYQSDDPEINELVSGNGLTITWSTMNVHILIFKVCTHKLRTEARFSHQLIIVIIVIHGNNYITIIQSQYWYHSSLLKLKMIFAGPLAHIQLGRM